MSLTVEFTAGITTMGPVKGELFPKRIREMEKFEELAKIKKHKFTIKIEPVD